MNKDYKVKDIDLAAWGCKEILLAEKEMPALMAFRKKYRNKQPLLGAKIIGCVHMTIQTAVLIETLVELGAQVRWSSCNMFSTQDHAAAAIANKGIPVYAWKGQTQEEWELCIEKSLLVDGEPWGVNLLLDDGGDLTALIHEKYPNLLSQINGVSEQTTTGVLRLYDLLKNKTLKIPAINVNDSVTKSKNDNKYGCRHSLNDAIKRGLDMLLSGRKALVMGYGDVGKGSAKSLSQEGMIVKITEVDPICAMQACMDGYEVVSCYHDGKNKGSKSVNAQLLSNIDLVVTATGNKSVCDANVIKALKSGCVLCNIGHFDHEIDVDFMHANYHFESIKEQVDQVYRNYPNKEDYLLLLSQGRLVNLGNATGHPSRIMDGSFANQVLAQILLHERNFCNSSNESAVYIEVLPKLLDEEIAYHMVTDGFGSTLTQLTDEQAQYIGVSVAGPFKNNGYKY